MDWPGFGRNFFLPTWKGALAGPFRLSSLGQLIPQKYHQLAATTRMPPATVT